MTKTALHMRGFSRVLGRLVGEENYPKTLVGDLTELLYLFEQGEGLLKKLLSHKGTKRQGAALVLEIEDFVNSDLGWTVRDLRPTLKRLVNVAYAEPKHAPKKPGGARRPLRARKRKPRGQAK